LKQDWATLVQVFPQSSQFQASSYPLLTLGLTCALCLFAAASFAEDTNANKKKDNHQSPLATIMQTRIWADTPEPKDFVKDHRPPASRLNYQPLTGSDPERPKLRTPAELKDLETELEAARVKADKKAGIKPAAAVVSNKPKPAAVTE
jgi:hypothetical protein